MVTYEALCEKHTNTDEKNGLWYSFQCVENNAYKHDIHVWEICLIGYTTTFIFIFRVVC